MYFIIDPKQSLSSIFVSLNKKKMYYNKNIILKIFFKITKKKKKRILNVSLDDINRITYNFDNNLDFPNHHYSLNHHHWNDLIDVL